MATWLIRGAPCSDATGDTQLFVSGGNVDGVYQLAQPGSGTAHLPIYDTAFAFVYLDGAVTPVTIADLPPGFTPDDAFTMHHVTTAETSQDSIQMTIAGLFDETFVGPFGTIFPAYTDTGLTGMTRTKFDALLGNFVLLTLITGVNLTSSVSEQSNQVYDPLFTFNLNGTYTLAPSVLTLPKLPPMPTRTPIMQGGGGRRGR